MPQQRYPVGIDLGTTFSSLSYVGDDGQPRAIRLSDGASGFGGPSYSIASALYFKSPEEVVVGNLALEYSVIDPRRLATRFKRQMGDPVYHVPRPGETPDRAPFEVDGRNYRPEELSALVLKRLKAAGEEQLGPIEDVVISVPYAFDVKRRHATQNAGRIAGFRKVELVDEPVAAAIAFGHSLFQGAQFADSELAHIYADQVILVFDLGGGTFDATIMRLENTGNFKVLATNGEEQLGGSDWDDRLLDLVCRKFEAQERVNPRSDAELLQELVLQTVEAKKTLSANATAPVSVTRDGRQVAISVSREEFEKATRDLRVRTTDAINAMFRELDREWNFIDQIVVVGGASRMPMIGEHVRNVSGTREINLSLSPDTAIAHGAALYAALKAGQKGAVRGVESVNSHPLGLMVLDPATRQLRNDIVIPQNRKTGTSVSKRYVVQEKARAVTLVVLQGDLDDPEMCVKLGRLRVNLPEEAPAPQRGTKTMVEVTYSFGDDGLLNVSGKVELAGAKSPVAANVRLEVENTMSEQEVEASAKTFRGVHVE